ncbi:MAG: hypothetical protein K8S20_02840 [Chloroflexi bacterium]|nr:hypothetical protein [Chloroflexota bacterium]
MSAFAVLFDRSSEPDPQVFNAMMGRLRHRGPDGCDTASTANVTMGHFHFWTTPEEIGEHQPLSVNSWPFKIVLDGRIDNRQELLDRLSMPLDAGRILSDAALILHAYARWGGDCFKYLVGEYALALFDEQLGELLVTRDALGDRTVFYSVHGTRVAVASEPWAVAAADGLPVQMNDVAVAHYFALRASPNGQTMFKHVYELSPATILVINAGGEYSRQYWQADPTVRSSGKSDVDYAEEFLSLLEQSVRCRLRSPLPVGVMMSGGLDSTSVAAMAAGMIAPETLTTLSYVFDELKDCDERIYIDAVKERWSIRSIQILCDDAWPYREWEKWTPNPNDPAANPYYSLHDRVYEHARAEGIGVLLTGSFGDHLYNAASEWLADLVFEGRWLDACRQLNIQIRSKGFSRTLRAVYIRDVARRVVRKFSGLQNSHPASFSPAWLTDHTKELLSSKDDLADPVLERYDILLGSLTAYSCSHEFFNLSHSGLEIRSPYRDRRLIEYVITLPAYQLYSRGRHKHILRNAMKDILPESVRNRTQPTSMIPLFVRGLEREKDSLQLRALDPDAVWRKYIKADWLLTHWNTGLEPDQDGPEAMVFWMCSAFEAWQKSIFSSN